MNNTVPPKPPAYVYGAYLFLFIALLIVFLVEARNILLPVTLSGLFASLLLPFCKRLEKIGLSVTLSALIAVFVLVFMFLLVFGVIGVQATALAGRLPTIQTSLEIKINSLLDYIQAQTDLSKSEQLLWLRQRGQAIGEKAGSLALNFFSATGSVMAIVGLIPVMVFFMLLMRKRIAQFIRQLGHQHKIAITDIVDDIIAMTNQYLKGILTVMLIVALLNTTGFFLLGLPYALLIGLIAAMLNIIPYIGVLIGSLLPITIALVTRDSIWIAVGALGVCVLVQFLDNNFITPKVTGSSVSINPLAAIIALLVGASIWGVVGMILSIPGCGVLKIIFDKIPSLHAYGILLGDDEPKNYNSRQPENNASTPNTTDTISLSQQTNQLWQKLTDYFHKRPNEDKDTNEMK
ncbi:MAG: AI-2E family transporter [Sphingobacteriales bacterium]|jgi:predicted PurR-regulated permease PerM|nr:AI-2E family transporter [Sphingobacteriales bacterium]MBP9142027.1 AI-2E family transporter [Chitinophagales bacterium]MDA0198991.1 AI-2E family transporter [Bacteroidota bacterium]MBK6890027.1 AI-2E family transporter [Sphingobacteriales bacterium]MBK7527447.1 AI-2E family transporter [Sphingobacteriales bacterium]